ncbi:MAG: DUF3048 domain-containing protein [Alicyclobacillaceae bacterium]|nr:DUF3048 domain-containing protein [Alicyclobacillaceae bacterium]
MWKRIAAAGAALALLAACGVPPVAKPEPSPAPAPGPKPAPEPPAPPPLGGTIAVMIDNLPEARPQAGLNEASIVVEALAEGPITRFEAFFTHAADKIGPVRSIRPYFVELARGLRSPLAHAGGSPEALAMMKRGAAADLDEIYNSGQAFWRDEHRPAPHNLYTDTARLVGAARTKGYSLGKLPDTPVGPMPGSGTPVQRLHLRWYHYTVTWDWIGGQFRRSEDGTPHLSENGRQVSAPNIAVLVAPARILDDQGRREIDVTGSGKAWFFTGGRMYAGAWSRREGEWFRFSTPAGGAAWDEGPLWIEIISDSSWMKTEP